MIFQRKATAFLYKLEKQTAEMAMLCPKIIRISEEFETKYLKKTVLEMIAKIGRSENLYGALAYNNLKVEKENGQILFTNKIIETPNRVYTVAQLAQSFAPYLIANPILC